MKVKINNQRIYEYSEGGEIVKLEITDPVLVVVDPSKTNMAVFVANLAGDKSILYEFSGKDMDTIDYCEEFDVYLREALKGLNILDASKEAEITPEWSKKGYNYHKSALVLKDVGSYLRHVFKDLTGKKVFEVNNWAWKTDVLPQGYRSQSEKGSHRYMAEKINPMYTFYTDDATDVICIYFHRRKVILESIIISCDKSETTSRPYRYLIMDRNEIPKGAKEFTYNCSFSLEENISFYVNRCAMKGFAEIKAEYLKPEEMCKHSLVRDMYATPALYIIT